MYIAGTDEWRRGAGREAYTPPMGPEPSEQYLTAIHVQLREHWPAQHDPQGTQNRGLVVAARTLKSLRPITGLPVAAVRALRAFCWATAGGKGPDIR